MASQWIRSPFLGHSEKYSVPWVWRLPRQRNSFAKEHLSFRPVFSVLVPVFFLSFLFFFFCFRPAWFPVKTVRLFLVKLICFWLPTNYRQGSPSQRLAPPRSFFEVLKLRILPSIKEFNFDRSLLFASERTLFCLRQNPRVPFEFYSRTF